MSNILQNFYKLRPKISQKPGVKGTEAKKTKTQSNIKTKNGAIFDLYLIFVNIFANSIFV